MTFVLNPKELSFLAAMPTTLLIAAMGHAYFLNRKPTGFPGPSPGTWSLKPSPPAPGLSYTEYPDESGILH